MAGFIKITNIIMILLFLLGRCAKSRESNFLNNPQEHPVETFIVLMALSMGYIDFRTERDINAAPDKVFSIITDYENYPVYFPDLHDVTTIISGVQTGTGVVWQNTGTFNGQTFTSTWEITEYTANEKVVMEDTEGDGKVILTISPAGTNLVKYTYDAHIKIFLPLKNEFLTILENEADSVKHYSELP